MMANRPRTLIPRLIGVTLLGLAAATAGAQAVSPEKLAQVLGQRVMAIRVVTESGTVVEQNPANLPLQPGQRFTPDAERASLEQLYKTGRFSNLVAEVTPGAGGLRLDFIVQRNFYVNNVSILGLREPPSESVALASLNLGFGTIFHASDLDDALARLRGTLRDEGFYRAKLRAQLAEHGDTREIDITVIVDPGPRARADSVTIGNETPFPEGELRGQLKLKSGVEITSERLGASTDRMRKWFVGRGYLGARVSVDRGSYDVEDNQVPLRVHLFAGLQVKVEVEGAKISSGTLHRLLPIYEEGAVDADLLEEGRRNLRDYLQSEGYFNAAVSYETSGQRSGEGAAQGAAAQTGEETITYSIDRGPRRRLVGIAFFGNRYFDDELLRSRVGIQPAAFASRGRFSTEQLADDVASITALYQANGFRQVHVTSELVNDYHGKQGDLFVRLEIQEGVQTRIASLKIEGNHALSQKELLSVVGSTAGQPYSDFNVAGDRDNLLALYYDQGFPQARFQASIENAPPGPSGIPRVRLVYRVDEGAQIRVAHVLISGYQHTRPSVIRRQIQLKPGQPLSEGAVVESQRRLYDLGIFSRVTIAPQNPNGSDADKNLGVLVEEAQRYTIAYGVGLEAQRLGGAGSGPVGSALRFSPRGTFEFTKLNLTGRADTLSFKTRASTLQGRALLSYTTSNYFGWPNVQLQVNALYDKTRDVLTFTSTRSEGSVQITKSLSNLSSLLFRYAYRHVVASDLQISPEQIPLFSQPTEVSLFGVTWLRDRRDNPGEPTRGSFNNISVDLAGKPIGSSASFLRAFLQNSTYQRIGNRLIFARSTRLGIETPVGQTVSSEIPLPERFFAGGGTTLRGFGLNQAGPRDPLTGFPVGGLAMLVFNQQLQFPMRLPFVGNRIGGAIFYDAGNVFTSFRQITLRTAPPSPVFDPTLPDRCIANCTNDLNYFSHTIGLELRYHTPIGPVSIDLAYQLNPAHFLIPDGTTLPDGTPGLKLSRLPAFEFFVNLGTAF
jgi:outer membrane protein insertion porin family